ncbi:helix-turn-helix domain-containing protein [Bifidobacterium callimiconis]|uniref:AraC family transcriptional regulator n=1 Tax=Bifidobacterium callimiconis TaxID=2306973 RepID=A0A430FBJ1_9BIFI|nr:AraC family transcriptional regulator [Bifidobacterium callimiconis]RSX50181.1 AraC family transcriptional regulator [Bifidobacterium callimiconis]
MTMTTTMNTTSTQTDHAARTVRLTIVGEHGEGIILDAHVDASLVERITVIAEQTPRSAEADLPDDRPVDHIVRRAIRFIDCNYASRIDVGEVARRINVDRSHLSRRFHVCTGMTVKQYIDTLRIRQAERLLAGTTMSVTRVAQRCGYASADVLTRRFRAVRQITPAQYRSAMTRPTAPRPETGPR